MKIIPLLLLFLTLFSPAHATTNILILGDSLTEGLGVDLDQTYPHLVQIKLKEHKHDVIVTNGGVSGATSASGESRLKWHMKKKIDILVLELGANDGLRGLKIEETEIHLKGIINLAKKNKIKVLLLGLLMPPNYGKEYTSQFAQMFKRISQTNKVPYLPFVLKGVAGISKLNQADGIHPNIEGHKIVAENVARFVENNL